MIHKKRNSQPLATRSTQHTRRVTQRSGRRCCRRSDVTVSLPTITRPTRGASLIIPSISYDSGTWL
eukprot:scaffold38672_cov56-Attheya_sp.AAC.1